MAAGFIVGAACVDVAHAVDAYYSAAPVAVAAGVPEYLTRAEKVQGGWDLVTYSGGSVVSSYPAPLPSLASCDTSAPFFDGLAMGWAVVAAMAVAWAVHYMRRAL